MASWYELQSDEVIEFSVSFSKTIDTDARREYNI